MLLLFELYLTHPLRYRVSLLASFCETILEPQMGFVHIIRTTKVNQAEYRYLNYELRHRLIAGIGIAGQRHPIMSRRLQHDGGTSRQHFLPCHFQDQDKTPLSQRRGATQKRITAARHSPTAPKVTEIDLLGKLQETTIL